ncbi:MAG: PilC/PilY family type IV pilus protein [Pseudomonadota bacterium]
MKTLLLALVLLPMFAMSHGPAGRRAAPPACEASATTRSTVALRPDGAGILIESSSEANGAGRLTLRALSAGAGGAITIGITPLWDAGAVLTGVPEASLPPRPLPQARQIYTVLRNADGSSSSIPFQWNELGAEPRSWLDSDGLGEARVAFLRGDRRREIGQPEGVFRRRTSILGDSMHSTPLLVGAPSRSVQGPGYEGFYERHKGRVAAIYFGANDGMLHAFDARDGVELFAYIPNALIPAISQLSDPDYRHRAYVDASAGQGEALLSGGWRSVLVSGMGGGARGVFALDVSDPAAFEAGERALWEFTERDDPAIGHVSEAPLIAKVRVGVKDSVPQYRFFAVVPSGAGSEADGALFLLALDKPASQRWQRDVNYFRLDAPAALPGQPNALGQPVLVRIADGSVRYAYAGDAQGGMWRFDLSETLFSSGLLFEARDDAGRRQPIIHAPRVVMAPAGGYLILFGTTVNQDPTDFVEQSFYAVKDSAASPIDTVNGRRELARRTLSGEAHYTVEGEEFDYAGARARKGWYFDFPHAATDGEHLAASPVLAGRTVLISTIVPGDDPCAVPSNRTYVLDTLTGFPFNPSGEALSGSITGELTKRTARTLPVVLELGAISAAPTPTRGARVTRKLVIVHLQREGAAPAVQHVDVSVSAGRISWREIANWQELHEAAKK